MFAQKIRTIIEIVEATKNQERNVIITKLSKRLNVNQDKSFWGIVKAIGWDSFTTDYKIIREALKMNYTPEEIRQLKTTAVIYRKRLQEQVKRYEAENNITNLYGTGDDGFWDYTAHIVGMGEIFYDNAMTHPEKVIDLDYAENFEYSFNID